MSARTIGFSGHGTNPTCACKMGTCDDVSQ